MYLPRIWSRLRSCPALYLLPYEPDIEAMPAPGCSSCHVLLLSTECRESSRWTIEQLFDDQKKIHPKMLPLRQQIWLSSRPVLHNNRMAVQYCTTIAVNRSDACRCTLAIATQMTGSSSLTAVNLGSARPLRRSYPC